MGRRKQLEIFLIGSYRYHEETIPNNIFDFDFNICKVIDNIYCS